jgi:hypothetical protein
MRELIDLTAVERLFLALAVAVPVLAVTGGAMLQARGRQPGALRSGILVGLLGPANWLLWRIYNGIEDHYGLDSVKAMLLNLALFAALGVATGIGVRCSVSGVRESRSEHRTPDTEHRTPNT